MGFRLVLGAPQSGYAAKLALYLREKEPDWEIGAFTQELALERYLQGMPAFDVMVIHPLMLDKVRDKLPKLANVIVLAETPGAGAAEGWPELLLYQPMSRLAAEIKRYSQGNGQMKRDATTLWTVFSASGGVGKTTLALNVVRQASERGLKVFYLNLELLNATDLVFGRGEPDTWTRLMYELQDHPEEAFKRIEKLRQAGHAFAAGAGYIDAPDHPAERLAITEERLKALIQALQEQGGYDLILADPDCGCGEWHRSLLEMSGQILWLAVDDAQCLRKTRKLIEYWQGTLSGFRSKVTFVMNKQLGELLNDWHQAIGAGVVLLPYMPQWKRLDGMHALLQASAFAGAVDRLLDQLGRSSPAERTESGTSAACRRPERAGLG